MPTVAFFFDAGQTPGGRYDALPKTLLFRRVLELDTHPSTRFEVRSGDLLIRHLAYQATAAELEVLDGKVRQGGMRLEADHDLYLLILWDFVDSLSEAWTSIDLSDVGEATALFGRNNVYVIALSSISEEWIHECDQVFAGEDWYIGAAEIDLGNPLHRRAIELPHTLTYAERRLGIVGEIYDEDSLLETVSSQGDWPSRVPFDRIAGVSAFEDDRSEAWSAPTFAWTPLSERGRLTQQRLSGRARRSHFERVARNVQRQSGPRRSDPPHSVSIAVTKSSPVVDPRKLTEYCLTDDPTRRDGFAKARVFRSALGITAADWRFLAAQLIEGLTTADPLDVRATAWGVKYHANIPIKGRNGQIAPVTTAWIITGDEPPRLTTAHVANVGTEVPIASLKSEPRVLEPDKRDNWERLYEMAHEAGVQASEETIPTPMFLEGYAPQSEGLCGFAWVVVPDARRRFPRWLIRNGHAYARHYGGGGAAISGNVGRSQSVDRARAYAEAFAHVLRINGVECRTESRLD